MPYQRGRTSNGLGPFRWLNEFREIIHRRLQAQGRLLGVSIIVGLAAGIGAIVFSIACQLVVHVALDWGAGYRTIEPRGEASVQWISETDTSLRPWALVLVPAAGGLLSGWLVFRFAPEAEGHGTDAAIAAYHFRQGRIRGRVPLVKLIASALTIGSGGSGGREGPIAQIGAGIGSQLGTLFHLRPAERRVLVAAGIGAGVAAMFRAPLAGALFSAEVLYRSPEFEQEVLIPAGLSSVVAYCTFGTVFGWEPLFASYPLPFSSAWELIPYLLLTIAMAVLAMFYTRTLAWFTAFFNWLQIPLYLKPCCGAALAGITGVVLFYMAGRNEQILHVLSFGYGVLQEGISTLHAENVATSNLSILLLMAIALGKILTTSLTIGSGGSGGVFGPSMVIGGCGGGALGLIFNKVWPSIVPHPASFMIVGMAGFFAAAAKTPFSSLAIVCEMTGDYELLLPAIWVCTLAFLFSDVQSLYGWQVENRSRSPAHQGAFLREVLADLRVADFLSPGEIVPNVHANDSLPKVIEHFSHSHHPILPVVDDHQRLIGVVALDEIHQDLHNPFLASLILVTDAMQTHVTPLLPSDTPERALELFAESKLAALPVVESQECPTLAGLVRRSEIVTTYLRRLHGTDNWSDSQSGVLSRKMWE